MTAGSASEPPAVRLKSLYRRWLNCCCHQWKRRSNSLNSAVGQLVSQKGGIVYLSVILLVIARWPEFLHGDDRPRDTCPAPGACQLPAAKAVGFRLDTTVSFRVPHWRSPEIDRSDNARVSQFARECDAQVSY